MPDHRSAGTRTLIDVGGRHADRQHDLLGVERRRTQHEREREGRGSTDHLILPVSLASSAARILRRYSSSRISFVSDDFDRPAPAERAETRADRHSPSKGSKKPSGGRRKEKQRGLLLRSNAGRRYYSHLSN